MSFFKIKPIWKGNSKHKKLSEELALQNAKEVEAEQDSDVIEAENDVVSFKLKYLGSTVVEKTQKDTANISVDAVKNIIKTAKATRKQQKKLQRVNIAISLKGIVVTDLQGNDIFNVSIYRISNCSTDATHRQVFSFISTDDDEAMQCHAFFCSKRKIAETVTLAVAKAFSAAYEAWNELPHDREFGKNVGVKISENDKENGTSTVKMVGNNVEISNRDVSEEKLIDFDSEGVEEDDWEFDKLCMARNVSYNSQWVSFEDEFSKDTVQMPHKTSLILV